MPRDIRRKKAASGNVDYSDPIRLHWTEDKQVELVPFYLPRRHGGKLSAKLIERGRRRKGAEISLNSQALAKLVEALLECGVVADEEAGNFLVIRTDGSFNLSTSGRQDSARLAGVLGDLLSSEEDVLEELLAHGDPSRRLRNALQTQGRILELAEAVDQLQRMLKDGVDKEHAYQVWCESHSWAFGNAYVVNDKIRSISATDRVDLLLPRSLGGFRDVIELKRPSMTVILWDKSHKSWYWSAETSKAIGQCHRYLDVLHQDVRDGRLKDSPDVVAYHPRATIVIGRSQGWSQSQHEGLHGLNSRLAHISVITFDHLLDQARATLKLVDTVEPDTHVIVPSEPPAPFDEEERFVGLAEDEWSPADEEWLQPDDDDGWAIGEDLNRRYTDADAWRDAPQE